jgi:hypothetical protein
MRVPVFAAAVMLVLASPFLAGPALADGPIATAGGAAPAAPQPTAPPPSLPTTEAAPVDGEQIAMGPCGPEKVRPDGQLETKPHGEIEAGVGTGGYRQIAGAVCQPIGQHGVVAASVSATQANPTYRRR